MPWLILAAMVVFHGVVSIASEAWVFGPRQQYAPIVGGYNLCCLVGVLALNVVLCLWPEKGDGR